MRLKTLITVLLLSLFSLPVLAQDGPPPPPDLMGGEIVVEGLSGPQGLFIDAEGNLWIIDSGMGGDETVNAVDPTTFATVEGKLGNTSQIIKRSPDGTQEVVALLPSVAVGTDFLGGARLTALDGTVYATVGAWQAGGGDEVSIPFQAQVVSITDSEPVTVADLWAHELANNPDGTDNKESHPYSIVTGEDGLLYVTDAAANDLLRVDPATGEVETLAVFEGLPGIFPNQFRNNEAITDPVPTAVVLGDEGSIYVSLLSGAPFIPGSAKVVSVAADGTVTDFATGLTMLTDLKLGPDGNLYATSFGIFTADGPVPNSGSILRIAPDGTAEVVISGLPFLTAIAIDAEGNGYVTINGIAIPGAGAVVYYEGLTGLAGTPLPAITQ
ncbi:MAG: ScyD/ScyE family protein [Phototrophicaceae bacterium]|jgi:sugar lactone lactonase YvrE